MSIELRERDPDQAQAVCDLIEAYDNEFVPADARETMSVQNLLDWWESEENVRLVYLDGELAAHVSWHKREERVDGDVFVHPRAWGRGVGTYLVELVEERARDAGAAVLRLTAHGNDERGACLLRSHGYERIRSFFRMLVDFDDEPPPAEWPDGLDARALEEGEERVLHEVLQHSFQDHWGFHPRPFDEWLKGRRIEHDVSFLVREGDEVVAASENRLDFLGMGWIGTLGTRPAHRRRGIAEALLRHSFRVLYDHGIRRVGLGVDAENPTGATRLYERVGMRVAWRADVYEKQLA